MRTSYISRDVREKRVGEATRGGHVRATADAQLQAELQDLPTQIAAIEVRFSSLLSSLFSPLLKGGCEV